MKKVLKKDERRRPAITRRNSSSKQSNIQSNSSNQGSAPRRLKNKLYICGLSPTVLREELIREFGKFGKLHDVWVAKKPPGFAFVEYINSRDAERVVHELDDTKVLGSKVRIEFAKANKGLEDSKKPKKTFPLGGSNLSGNKSSNKPAIAPLMGQLIVPSLLTANLNSSISLLGSPPVSALALPNLAGTYKRNRSSRDNKRYRGDSGSRWELGLRKPISPLMKRFSRSPVGRGRGIT